VPFYVMEYIPGAVLTNVLPDGLSAEAERRKIGEELVDALVELHSVSPPEDIRASRGYLDRQLRRFQDLWEHSKTREIDSMAEVTRLLKMNVPATAETTVVHGDYRLGNAIFDSNAPANLVAILDWELATIGDPLADVGYLTATWVETDYSPGPLGLSPVTALPGFPNRAELTRLYEERSGRSVTDLGWYRALALWKAAIFLEGNYRRWRAGLSDDAYYEKMDVGVPRLVELAHAELSRG
jgi:aminoglycoside phosphotransferase (APT) family kinase protein